MMSSARVLYITYDGILEPLGQSQVLQYLEQLARKHRVVLVSYEKAADWKQTERRQQLQRRVEAAGIEWIALRYHKRPSALATSFDLMVGLGVGTFQVWRRGVQIVHARSYVPSVLGLALKRLLGTRFVFDMRGFWADERIDGDLWKKDSALYRTAKWFERRFLDGADVVISLTEAGVGAMAQLPYPVEELKRVEVIRTCTNLELFQPRPKMSGRPFTLAYVGSVGTWYLFEEVLRAFAALRDLEPDARLLVVNRGEHDFIRRRVAAQGLPKECIELKAVAHAEVSGEIARADAGVFFIKPVFSKKASAPTKLGEFLGCGLPCLGNVGVGDVETILEGERVGVALRDFSEDSLREGVRRLLALSRSEEVRRRCVEVARRYFSLDQGVLAYDRIYRELVGQR